MKMCFKSVVGSVKKKERNASELRVRTVKTRQSKMNLQRDNVRGNERFQLWDLKPSEHTRAPERRKDNTRKCSVILGE